MILFIFFTLTEINAVLPGKQEIEFQIKGTKFFTRVFWSFGGTALLNVVEPPRSIGLNLNTNIFKKGKWLIFLTNVGPSESPWCDLFSGKRRKALFKHTTKR